MDNLKKMDAQPSQLQQKMMMDALGNVNADPNAILRITDIMDEVIRGKVSAHNKRIPPRLPQGDLFRIELPDRVIPTTVRSGPSAQGKIRQGGPAAGSIEFLGFEPASQ
jgi:hypothetical protein